MNKAPLIGISRLRMGTDGYGVTTLVAFHGCPLRCKYCLNPQSLSDDAKVMMKTPEEVMQAIRKDELYYLATNGGVTFGGGEPLLRADFIKEVLELGAKQWHITIETSLNVPQENLVSLFPYIHEYVVDIKDMNPCIYKAYNGRDNELVKTNLRWIIEQGKAEHITCRIPLIPEFNTSKDQQRSKQELEAMGITRFDLFTYRTNIKK